MKHNILFLSTKSEITREREGYYSSLIKQYDIFTIEKFLLNDNRIDIEQVNTSDILIAIYGDAGLVPENITKLNCPTVCFQIDTFSALKHRINISKLFDLTVVFHPGYEKVFKENGISNTLLLPHAIDHQYFFDKAEPGEREIEVAFVGDIKRKGYSVRKKIVEAVLPQFKCNDYRRYYEWKAMISLFSNSKIVLNIPRDDYLIDANLRVFEATASGALLMTLVPSELQKIGYVDGKHFVGFSSIEDLTNKIKYYLQNEDIRKRIADEGTKLTIESNNYKMRAQLLIEKVDMLDRELINNRPDKYNTNLLFLKYYSNINHKTKTNQKFLELLKAHPFKGLAFILHWIKPYLAGLKHSLLSKTSN